MILNKQKCQPYFVNEKWSSQLKIDSILWTLRKRERAKNRERDRDKKVKKGINQRKAKKMNENECKRNFYKIF